MRRLLILAPLALAACTAPTSPGQVVADACQHKAAITLAANVALQAAGLITDPNARMAAVDAANASLALVASCPAS
jgi:hypothetical protein